MKKYNYIDLARTITMFGVIINHILLFFSNNPFWYIYADEENEIAVYLCEVLNVTVVQIFVLCSGFLFQASIQNKEVSILTSIVKKAKRLLLPFFLYGLVWLVPTYTIFDIPTSGRLEGTSLLDGYQAMLLGRFCDVSWFLLMLFWVSIIWILLKDLLKKERFIIGAVAATALFFASHFLLADVNFYKINQIDIYLIIFFVGASFYWIADKVNKLPLSVLMLISVSGVALCSILAPYTSIAYWLYCVLAVLMPVFVVIFAMAVCKLKIHSHVENTNIYKWLLKHNMDIYLLQAPGMYLSFWLVYPLVGKNCALCVIVTFTVTVAIDFILVILLTYIRKLLSPVNEVLKKVTD
ncbi:MAG: acyltransferase family protein [Roseburia sp.]